MHVKSSQESKLVKIVICTCKAEQTEEITDRLLRKRLIAGVNVIPGIFAKYWWKDRVESSSEDFLIMETKKSLVGEIIKEIKSIHSYQTPKVISIDVEDGLRSYMTWVTKETRSASE